MANHYGSRQKGKIMFSARSTKCFIQIIPCEIPAISCKIHENLFIHDFQTFANRHDATSSVVTVKQSSWAWDSQPIILLCYIQYSLKISWKSVYPFSTLLLWCCFMIRMPSTSTPPPVKIAKILYAKGSVEHSPNVAECSFYQVPPILDIEWKHSFFRNVANRQTDRQTDDRGESINIAVWLKLLYRIMYETVHYMLKFFNISSHANE